VTILKIRISTRLPAARVAEFLREISRAIPNEWADDALPVFIVYDSEAPSLDEYWRLGRALLSAPSRADEHYDRLRDAGVPEGTIAAIRLAGLCCLEKR